MNVAINRAMTWLKLYEMIHTVKGSIVELGVGTGSNLYSLAAIQQHYDPYNASRRFVGFDTFSGFPEASITDKDQNPQKTPEPGNEHHPLDPVAFENGLNGYLGPHGTAYGKQAIMVQGDICETVPQFVHDYPHVLVALLILDVDLYKPTLVGLEHFLPRMPKGGVIVFDELDMAQWPGETQAILEAFDLNELALRRFPWESYQCYAVME